jgi:hypothetical protein
MPFISRIIVSNSVLYSDSDHTTRYQNRSFSDNHSEPYTLIDTNILQDISLDGSYRIIERNEVTNEMDGIIMDLSLSYGVINAITSSITRYYLIVNFIGTTSTFIPMHFLGFNVMPRRIPDLSDY